MRPTEIDDALREKTLTFSSVADVPGHQGAVLRARAALSTQLTAHMLSSLAELRAVDSLQAQGLCIALCAQLGLADEGLLIPFDESAVANESDEDGAYWAHLGRTAIYMAKGTVTGALEELGMARVYAIKLRSQHRNLFTQAERQRLAGHAGLGNAERTLELVQQMPPDSKIREWTLQTYLTDLLSSGRYAEAASLEYLGNPISVLARALARVEEPRNTTGQISPLHNAAFSVSAVMGGRVMPSPQPGTSMGARYSQLFVGLGMSRSHKTSRSVLSVVGEEPPMRKDQRALWAFAVFNAFIYGSAVPDPLALPAQIGEALDDLSSTADVMNLIEWIVPEAVLVLSVGPNAHDAVMISAANIANLIAGRAITPVPRKIHLPAALSGVDRMQQAARDAQRSVTERQWLQARFTLGMYSESTETQSPQSVHCVTPDGGVNVKA